ncbi:MAPEG family protein [Sagittula stellata]|uniref:Inner membrane protein n=1 Tax=Sagittula stellata (strain ATCC 700073 / DSM 11524 / E-37) TaxID=388399 RepID=A3K3M3_SAGS3|nr:MAPEG family protein [Sagittula stellata]EBA08137.1 inner membrane protein [Sagittula stellata E-37]
MTPELAALAATVLVHLAAVVWSQKSFEKDVGREGNLSPRDGSMDLSVETERLKRALGNHTENIAPFVIAVVLVQFTDSNSWVTALFAWVFVAARALYLPAYALGWVPWRSYLFMAGLLSTLIMIVAAFV